MKTPFSSFMMRVIAVSVIILFPICAYCQIPSEVLGWKNSSGAIYSSPLVVDSIAFVGDLNGKFSALNANTGYEIWSFNVSKNITSNPNYSNGVVVFEADDRLYGLNAKTGEHLWSYKSTDKTTTEEGVTTYNHSSPVVEGNSVYFGDEWGYLNGVNIATGELVFQYHIPFAYHPDSLFQYNIRSTPIIKDSIIYFGDSRGSVFAISLKDKSEKWITKMENPRWNGSIVSEMVIDNGVLYCGRYTNALIPLDLETGKQLWKFSDWETFLPSTPVFYKDNVIIGTTISSNHIYALNKKTGEKSWELKVKGIFFVKPIIVQDSVLVMNSTDPFYDLLGVLYFIDLNRGKIINEISLPNSTESSPILHKNLILIGKNDGLYAFYYKPLIGKPGSSEFSFDISPIDTTIKNKDKLSLSFPLINTGIFNDTLNVNYEIDGDSLKKNITLVQKKDFPVRPGQKVDITVKTQASKLNPGIYTVKAIVSSSRQASNPLYEKTVRITVLEASGSINLNVRKTGCTISPNPFIDNVNFNLSITSTSTVDLTIHTIDGKPIFSNRFETKPGNSHIVWNGCDGGGKPVSKGLYIYQLSSGGHSTTGKLLKTQ